MSHEITATRKYVEESVRKPIADLASHVGDLLLHVSAEDRARWNSAGRDGKDGQDGAAGKDGTDGTDGADGKSAYEIACDNGFEGTVAEWLESLKGEVTFDALTPEQKESLKGDKGDKGDKGNPGQKGDPGKAGTSVYVQSYEASTKPGGKSVLVLHDSRDTRIEILNGRDGEDGEKGDTGEKGEKGEKGERGSRWNTSDSGTFSGDDTTPGNFSGVGTFVDDAQPGDMLLMTSTRKIYECIAARGEPYDGTVQEQSLWKYRMAIAVEKGERGSRWHASDAGTFSGSDAVPGYFDGVGTFVEDARPGDMLLITSTHKMYECIAARDDIYDEVVQEQSLWAYRMAVVGEKGDKGDKGDMSTFVPADTFANMVNQSSLWLDMNTVLLFPCPTVAEGQLLEYVLYVNATAQVTIDPDTAFSLLTDAGYTVYSNNDNLMDPLPSGTIAAFTVSQMGKSKNVSIMRVLLGTAIAAPAAQ